MTRFRYRQSSCRVWGCEHVDDAFSVGNLLVVCGVVSTSFIAVAFRSQSISLLE